VIGLFYDKGKFPLVYKNFEEAGKFLALREDMRIGVATEKVLVMNTLKNYKYKLETTAKNIIILLKYENGREEIEVLDLEVN
jgi:hypothetical protein